MDERIPWLTIAHAPALHAGQLAGWLDAGHAVPDLFRGGGAGLGRATRFALERPDRKALARDLAWLDADPARRLVTWGACDYPRQLAQIPDAPLVLFVEGRVEPLHRPQLAIVGSRHPTALGRDTAVEFARELGRAGLAITSGLALGIDAAAHRGALEAGAETVAVLGCGLDTVYPVANTRLAREIVAAGGTLVSDLPTGTPPLRHHFPRRNRILSGLSVGTLVVEAALQSGSLITARLAAEQGREVFAMPGSIHNAVARGCHRLLRQGARLVESVEDIFEELRPILGESVRTSQATARTRAICAEPPLDKDFEILLDALGFEPASLDALVTRSGLETGAVASMLLLLELDGRIQQQPGGRYSRTLPGR